MNMLDRFCDQRCSVTLTGVVYDGVLRKMAHHPRAWLLEVERAGKLYQVQFLDSAVINITY